jgi:DnaK suppressor protein
MAAKQATAGATATRKVKVLTEEDLLKAPEKDYMNEAQLGFFRQRLIALRDQLLQNADDTGEHLRENEVTTDPSDRATLEEEYTLELRTRDRERKLLKKVEKSIRMIDDGSYGYCEETGEPIGIPRLLARPATLSLEAQERRERVRGSTAIDRREAAAASTLRGNLRQSSAPYRSHPPRSRAVPASRLARAGPNAALCVSPPARRASGSTASCSCATPAARHAPCSSVVGGGLHPVFC